MSERRAKIFTNGGSQAVRLPKDCRFEDATEVRIRREGTRVVLEPVDEWSARFLKALGAWAEDIPRPSSPLVTELRDPWAR